VARQLRIEYEGAIYHLLNRGDRREDIFQGDADRKLFLATLAEVCAKTGWQVHAYCLMGNHYHLVVETPQANLVAGMSWFGSTYTARFNRRHKLFGHLFSGRYKSLLVDADHGDYFQTVCDYVHLNPARANLVKRSEPLRAYRWSSFPLYLQPASRRPDWLRTDRVLGAKATLADRRQYERDLEGRRLDPPGQIYEPIRRGWCYGAESFREKLLGLAGGWIKESHSAVERTETDQARGERIIGEELAGLGWGQEEWRQLSKGDAQKVRIAKRLRAETTLSLKWIAARLSMGTWTSLSYHLYHSKTHQKANRA
jgi:REP element-mobilizing transposase RayT